MKTPTIERLLLKVEIQENGCWIFTGSTRKGYGQIRDGSRIVGAHRFAYQYFIDEISPEMDIDHTCRNPICINPDHLFEATRRETVLRGEGLAAQNAKKTHCIRGHRFTKVNTYFSNDGKKRKCKTCIKEKNRTLKINRFPSPN